MASMEEPIIVRIVNESSLGNSPGTLGGSSGKSNDTAGAAKAARSFATVIGSAFKLNAAYNIVHEGVEILKNATTNLLNPIRTILTGITKLLVQILRPISDMLILMLMPILMLLKPIIRAVTEVMKPFRKIAFDLMREAGTKQPGSSAFIQLMQGANTAILTGLGMVIVTLAKEIIKLLVTVLGGILKTILEPVFMLISIFSEDAANNARRNFSENIDIVTNGINNGLDMMVETIQAGAATAIISMKDNLVAKLEGLDMKTGANTAGNRMQEAINDFWKQLNVKGGSSTKVISGNISGSTSGGTWIAPDSKPGSSAFINTGASYGDNWTTTLIKANANKLPANSLGGGGGGGR